jgi:SAM-dependent methyltransferase
VGDYNESFTNWKKFIGLIVYFDPGLRSGLDFRVMYLPAQPNRRLLEVECGSGQMLKFMQDLGWCVEGVDFDPAGVGNANAKGLQVRLGTLESQKYPNDYFDVIPMGHLIEHVHDPLQLMRECNRILKPGGSLVVVTPNGESWGHKLFKDTWRGLEPPRHLHIFTSPSLRSLAKRAGFQKLRMSTTIRDANGLFLASRSIQRKGKHVMGRHQPLPLRIWARGMQLVEWAILKVRPGMGEEIVLLGEK